MNIAVLGASGWLGSTISAEALARGHRVIGLARNPQGLAEGITPRAFDLNAEQSLAEALAGADLLIASVGGRAAGNHEIVPATAARLLAAVAAAARGCHASGREAKAISSSRSSSPSGTPGGGTRRSPTSASAIAGAIA